MTPSYKLAASINAAVNRSTTYRTDAAQFGRPDFWIPAGRLGDCEDYALAKRAKLLAAGWPLDKLGLALCRTETGEYHCVLWVSTDRGEFILDNRQLLPTAPSDLPYEWDKMLRNGKWYELSFA